jgi:hypothetical protein
MQKQILFNCKASKELFLKAAKVSQSEIKAETSGSILTGSASVINCAEGSPYVYKIY